MGLRLLDFGGKKKKSWLVVCNNVGRLVVGMDIEGILVDLRNLFL